MSHEIMILLCSSQPKLLLSGKRERGARPAQKHKTCAIMTNLEAQGWRKPAPAGAGAAIKTHRFYLKNYNKRKLRIYRYRLDIQNKVSLNSNLNYSEYFSLFFGGEVKF